MSNKTFYIYSLMDPRDDSVYYVGCTVDPKRRYYQHGSIARAKRNDTSGSARNAAIINAGLRPILTVHEGTANAEIAAILEQRVIGKLRARGHSILNTRTGNLSGMGKSERSFLRSNSVHDTPINSARPAQSR